MLTKLVDGKVTLTMKLTFFRAVGIFNVHATFLFEYVTYSMSVPSVKTMLSSFLIKGLSKNVAYSVLYILFAD